MASATAGLAAHAHDFLRALAANDPSGLAVAPNVRFTENGQALELGRGLWAIATGVPDFDYALVEDPELSQVAWIGVVEEGGSPAVVFARLHVSGHAVDEIELVVRREHERLFDPGNMTEPRAILFEEVPPAERSPREQLVHAANLYFDGLEQASAAAIPVADACVRIENGTQTVHVEDVSAFAGSASALIFPLGVREQIDSGYFSYMDAVRDRRVVAVDEARGLVLLVVVFDHSALKRTVQVQGIGEVEVAKYHQRPNSVLIAELFKVSGGEIVHIEAVLEFLPYGAGSGWDQEGE